MLSQVVTARSLHKYVTILVFGLLCAACGPSQIDFAVVHVIEEPGEQIVETIDASTYPALDNTDGTEIAQVEIQFERNFQYQIIEQITREGLDSQRVRDKIVQLY